jgi:hypothetical protein
MEQQTPQSKAPVAQGTLTLFTAPAKMVSAPLERHFQKNYAGRYRYARHLFFFDLGLFCVALALAVTSAALIALPAHTPEPVLLRLEQSPRAVFPSEAPKNGAPVAFTATLQNRSGAVLSGAVLRFRLPPSFRVLSAPTAFHEDTGTLTLGDVPDGATRVVGVTALALREARTENIPKVFLQLSGQRGETPFDVVLVEDVEMVRESVLTALPTFPVSVVSGDVFSVPVTVENRGGVALGPLRISVCPQQGFLPANAEDRPDDCVKRTLPLLGAGEQIVVPLPLTAQAPRLDARIGVSLAIETPRGSLTLFDQPFVVRILKRYATVRLSVGSLVADETTRPWNLELIGRDPALTLVAGELLHIVGDTQTVLTQLSAQELSALANGESVVIRTAQPAGKGVVVVDLTARVADEEGEVFHLRSAPVSADTSAPVSFEATGRYYSVDGEQLGRGPLPPVVGEQTIYWLFLRASALPTAAVDITATLPVGVRWLEQQSVSPTGLPAVMYDASKRTIRWSARGTVSSAIEDGVGIAVAVGLTPSAKDIGKEITLLPPAVLTVQYEDGTSTAATTTPITTALIGDALAAGMGRVVGE